MSCLCWILNDGTQHEFVGINSCAVDMLNALPTDKTEIRLIAHNSDYDARFSVYYLDHVKPIVKSNRVLHIKTTYYNPIQTKNIKLNIKYSYNLISMPLRQFGCCFTFYVSTNVIISILMKM